MIVQRLAENIRKQNWFTVFIEFVLVILSVLIALEVNNWNEDRESLKQTHNYLAIKLQNLQQDTAQLNALHAHRKKLEVMSADVFENGYENTPDYVIVKLINLVLIERKFTSTLVNVQRDSNVAYFKNISGTDIETLEKQYLDLVDVVTFSETRLNIFSETLENDIWRSGFFNENRELFLALEPGNRNEYDSKNLPALKRKDTYAINSFLAILRRNEVSAWRLTIQYEELIRINEALQSAISDFLKKT